MNNSGRSGLTSSLMNGSSSRILKLSPDTETLILMDLRFWNKSSMPPLQILSDENESKVPEFQGQRDSGHPVVCNTGVHTCKTIIVS